MSITTLKLRFMRLVIFFIAWQTTHKKNRKEDKEKRLLQESLELLDELNTEIESIEQEEKQ